MVRHHPIHRIVHVLVAIAVILIYCASAQAESEQEVRLFVVEKSINPENILVVYAKVDSSCSVQFISEANHRYLFDFYWLMSGTTYKPTHRLIKKEARRRFMAKEKTMPSRSFSVLLADLKGLDHDLPSDHVEVETYRNLKGRCQSRVILILGPRHDNRTMVIDAIYSAARTFFSIPIGIHYIELRGRDIINNEPIIARFNSNASYDYRDEMDRDNSNDP